ncbi:MAG: DUF2232 domain-containing protein [Gemmatimonadaceae bacterium]
MSNGGSISTPSTPAMSPAMASAPRERGWRLLVAALVVALFVPLVAALRAIVPIEQTILLIAPAMAGCALVGWMMGGRFWLALIWAALAAWVISAPGAIGGGFLSLSRGWALVLSASFALVGALSPNRPFFPRALSAVAMSFLVSLALIIGTRVVPSTLSQSVEQEFNRRLDASSAQWQRTAGSNDWHDFAVKYPAVATVVEEGERQLRAIPPMTATLFPALLAMESLAILGLAWSLYHRATRSRIGAPMRALSEFRFSDQLVWGLVVGVTMLVIPTLQEAHGLGLNLVVFFGALYALRGLGVLDWFLAPRGFVRALFIIAIFLAWPVVGVFSLGLGLGDTWIDWRGRARPTT